MLLSVGRLLAPNFPNFAGFSFKFWCLIDSKCLTMSAFRDGIDEYVAFLGLHRKQLETAHVPELLWHTLFVKVRNQIFDAGDGFLFAITDEDSKDTMVVAKPKGGINTSNENHIYLIDHAWTFEANDALLQLSCVPNLLPRMAALMNISQELPPSEQIKEVSSAMWKYLRPYSHIVSADDPPVTFWYVMDELGSSIKHSSTPNFRAVPFYYQSEQIAYTLLFPIADVDEFEVITIDYVEGAAHDKVKDREALLVPWTNQSFISEPKQRTLPGRDYFLSGVLSDDLPDSPIPMPDSLPNVLKVFTEYAYVEQYLSDPAFTITNNYENADVLWLTRHFSDFKGLAETRPGTFINQFPCERVITTKDLLNIVSCRLKSEPVWLPVTYNLLTELPLFVGEFQRREAAGLDNHWICKPWNLARALDTTVTNNLNCILRLPFSGPKIAQKYADTPVLYSRPGIGHVKFDIRYVVLLESVKPLKLHCYKNFFLRFANKPFSLSDLWDYEKHFTVMNYRDDSNLHEVTCEEFKVEFAAQYKDHSWDEVQSRIFQALREVFEAACVEEQPMGLGHHPQSRAVYAADLILSWVGDEMQPLLLEINFGPDCGRACRYYPDFYNDIFGILFKNQSENINFHTL